VIDRARLERCPLLGQQRPMRGDERHTRAGVEADDLEVILSLALEELLLGGLANSW
jgi:hypothetical protein